MYQKYANVKIEHLKYLRLSRRCPGNNTRSPYINYHTGPKGRHAKSALPTRSLLVTTKINAMFKITPYC